MRVFTVTAAANLARHYYYYSFKIFPRFWLGKTTRIIHHDQLLNSHIELMTSKWRHRFNNLSYWTVILNRWPRKPGDEVELFWLFEQNGWTVGRTLCSFHGEILSKNMARTAKSQLDGQHLLFGVYLQTLADLYLLNFPKKMRYRCELNIDRGKHF